MNRVHEKRIFRLFLIFQIIGFILTIILSIYAIFYNLNNNIQNVIFETIYLFIHFIISFFLICLYFLAIKEGSSVFKSFKDNFNIRINKIVSLIIFAISLLLFIYFALVLLNVNLYYFNFPKILNIEIFLASYLVFITSLTNLFYLDASKKDDYFLNQITKGNTL